MLRNNLYKIIIILLFTLKFSVCLSDDFTIYAKAKSKYWLKSSGFVKVKLSSGILKGLENWVVAYKNGQYYRLTQNHRINLIKMKSDQNIIVLRQEVLFSGHRIISLFRKTKKFIVTEVSSSMLSNSENLEVIYGTWNIR